MKKKLSPAPGRSKTQSAPRKKNLPEGSPPAPDSAERQRTEKSLRESEERFRMMADNISQLAWTCDLLGNVTWYNHRWLDYTGLSFEAMQGWDWSKVQHPDHLDRVVARVKRSSETGEPWEDTFPLRGRDGNYRWFLSRAVPIRDAQGKLLRWFGTNTDITELRQAQEALLESSERLRFMAESMPQKVFTAKSNGDVDYFNPQWAQYTGLTFQTGLGWDWRQFVHPDDLEENSRHWERSIQTGEEFRFAHRFRRADGVYRWHLSSAQAMRDAEGKTILWIGSSTDINDQKQAEEILEKRVQERIAEVRRLSLKFLTLQDDEHRSISRELHDSVGQHLAFIQISIGRLRQGESPGNQTELLAQLSESVDVCLKETRTISHLLHPPLLDEVGFPAAAKWFVEQFAERSGIKVNLDLANDSKRLLRSVELPLFRVLQASLSNVHRHAESPSAEVRYEISDKEAKLEVTDYGKGIKEDLLTQFNLTGSGSGMGMAGMRERVRELGGRLEVESGNRGTRIRAVIPLSKPSATKKPGRT